MSSRNVAVIPVTCWVGNNLVLHSATSQRFSETGLPIAFAVPRCMRNTRRKGRITIGSPRNHLPPSSNKRAVGAARAAFVTARYLPCPGPPLSQAPTWPGMANARRGMAFGGHPSGRESMTGCRNPKDRPTTDEVERNKAAHDRMCRDGRPADSEAAGASIPAQWKAAPGRGCRTGFVEPKQVRPGTEARRRNPGFMGSAAPRDAPWRCGAPQLPDAAWPSGATKPLLQFATPPNGRDANRAALM